MILTNEFIRGLVVGEGCFTFTTANSHSQDGSVLLRKIPAFCIAMNERDRSLIEAMRDHLKLKNRVYIHKSYQDDGYKRGKRAVLIVRELGSLKNVIMPFFYKKLRGYKAIQFENWVMKIEKDPMVPRSYKILYRLYVAGFWDRNPKYD